MKLINTVGNTVKHWEPSLSHSQPINLSNDRSHQT